MAIYAFLGSLVLPYYDASGAGSLAAWPLTLAFYQLTGPWMTGEKAYWVISLFIHSTPVDPRQPFWPVRQLFWPARCLK